MRNIGTSGEGWLIMFIIFWFLFGIFITYKISYNLLIQQDHNKIKEELGFSRNTIVFITLGWWIITIIAVYVAYINWKN